jgi:hypothetical protein
VGSNPTGPTKLVICTNPVPFVAGATPGACLASIGRVTPRRSGRSSSAAPCGRCLALGLSQTDLARSRLIVEIALHAA